MRDGWTRNEGWKTEAYDFASHKNGIKAFVSLYEGREDSFFQVTNDLACVHGIKDSLFEAMLECERLMDMPIDDFNAIAIKELVAELTSIEKRILRIAPNAELLLGYQAGYDAGAEATKQRIINTLQ